METNISMGMHCRKCNITIGTMATVGGKNLCPECGGEMQAAPNDQEVRVISNFTCSCGCHIGHLSVVGGKASCPQCGKSI